MNYLPLLLPVILFLLYINQRQLYWSLMNHLGMRWIVYLFVMPSTVAHELAHASMAVILRVPFGRQVGGKVVLFKPEHREDGSVQLGYVTVAHVDPLRNALIAIAPLLLVPFMILGVNAAFIGEILPNTESLRTFFENGGWQVIPWAILCLLLPAAAFPSPGDHVGFLGGLGLVLLIGGIVVGTYMVEGTFLPVWEGLSIWTLIMIPAGIANLLLWGIFKGLSRG